ncbi:hypothetical protein PanWU01x14_053380 [Parasponia andersonii]|uniref:RNase H type-1 domain-containing protein n=1 Tax=Parasponia andersonii TaxID=3476 RepID=A0A2P5DLH8_PARAD|nr:hypothetical protein PanWU01x14_053380 [Parasponia andersonii]
MGIIKHTSRLPSFEFGDVAFQLTFKNLTMTSFCSDFGVQEIIFRLLARSMNEEVGKLIGLQIGTDMMVMTYKMNVDTAINAQSRSVGVGAIIHSIGAILRNANGKIMAALAKKVTFTLLAKNVETKALVISLLWARDVGLNLQLLESDALTVVQALNNGSLCHSEFGDLLLDVSSLFSFCHNPRPGQW